MMMFELVLVCVQLVLLVIPSVAYATVTDQSVCAEYAGNEYYVCEVNSSATCHTRGCCWDEQTQICYHSTETVYISGDCTYVKAYDIVEGFATLCSSQGSVSGDSQDSCIQDACDLHAEKNVNGLNFDSETASCYVRNCEEPLTDGNLKLEDDYGGRDIWVRVLDYCSDPVCGPGTCSQTSARYYTCSCPEGLTGYNCEQDLDDCVNVTCENQGRCVDALNSYSCDCPEGFDGIHCDIDNYNCALEAADRIGCDTDSQDVCLQKGCCWVDGSCFHGHNTTMTITSNCTYIRVHPLADGLATYCSNDDANPSDKDSLGDCLMEACEGGDQLYNAVNMYLGISCYLRKCETPLTDENLELDLTTTDHVGRDIWIRLFNYCEDNTCANSGVCKLTERYFTCECQPGYEGDLCQTDSDECQSEPCHQGECVDNLNNYNCLCLQGYTGVHCELEIDECLSSPCQNGGNCEDSVNFFTCDCPEGYSSDLCEIDIDDCAQNPCGHGECIDGVNEYSCECDTSHTGVNCDQEIDECASSPCQNGATCTDHVDFYTCDCTAGYTGFNCEQDIDECSSNPCVQGDCTEGLDWYLCECVLGFTGTNCDINIDDCLSDPCVQGQCMDGVNEYMCECTAGFTGTTCDSELDECSSSPCQNGGTCSDNVNSFTCECVGGFTGTSCETDELSIGSQNAQQNSPSSQSSNTPTGTVVGATVPTIVLVSAVSVIVAKVLYDKAKKAKSLSKVSPDPKTTTTTAEADPDPDGLASSSSRPPIRYVDSYIPPS